MKRWKVYLGLFVLFTSGVAVGAAGTGLVVRARVQRSIERGPEATHQAMMRYFDRRLALSEEQHREIAAIIKLGQIEHLRIRSSIRPEVLELFNRLVSEVAAKLTPEQREQFDKDVERYRKIQQPWLQAMDEANAGTDPENHKTLNSERDTSPQEDQETMFPQ